MRIAMVSMHTSPADRPGTGDAGGMNVYALETARALAAAGHRVDLVTRASGADRRSDLAPGVTLTAVQTGGGVVRKHELPNLADAFGERLRQTMQERGAYDVIHAHYWLSGLAALPVSLALGVPIVQTFHTLAVEKDRRVGVREPERRRLTERYLAHEVDAIVAVSAAEASVVIDDLDATAERVWLARPGVDTLAFSPQDLASRDTVRARLGVRDHESLLVVVGRVQHVKGQDVAVRMLASLPGTVLVLAGEPPPGDRPYLEQLLATARELDVADRLRCIGGVDRDALPGLLGAADLALMPSRAEAFGIAALEAAACGTPVVAAAVGGLLEAVTDQVTGVLVDSHEPAVWATACRQLLDDPVRTAHLASRARAGALEHSWARTASALERVYESAQG